jgi:hypothetical protein
MYPRRVEFILLTLGLLGLLFLILAGLARATREHGVAELLDWKPTRSYETEAQLELDDVQQMLDAQNEMRRKRGAKEITEEDVRRQAKEDEAMRLRGRGPFAQGGGLDDEVDQAPPPPRRRQTRRSNKSRSSGKARSKKN